jgi:hypothetical protein
MDFAFIGRMLGNSVTVHGFRGSRFGLRVKVNERKATVS